MDNPKTPVVVRFTDADGNAFRITVTDWRLPLPVEHARCVAKGCGAPLLLILRADPNEYPQVHAHCAACLGGAVVLEARS